MSWVRACLATLAMLVMAGCSVQPGDADQDPFEPFNRKMHDFNNSVDGSFLRSAGEGYVNVVSQPVHENITNFSDTVSLPRTVVNQVLQGRPGDATRNFLRFGINATLGIAGLADVASDMGIQRDSSDFGETLATWGVPEGAYLVLPYLGPSTQRDSAGMFVDLFTNPIFYVAKAPGFVLIISAKVAETVGDRGRFSGAVDSILYESADPYTQVRLIYLQNRRYELGEAPPVDDTDPLELDTEGF